MKGKVTILVTDAQGIICAQRYAENAVMKSGGELIAKLFSGLGSPITHMGVGTSEAAEPEDFSTAALANDAVGDIPPLAGETETALSPQSFSIVVNEEKRVVQVKIRGTLPAEAAQGTIREAGLVSKAGESSILYNRVTFAPITKGNDHELTLFWDVSFPYGDLQWF